MAPCLFPNPILTAQDALYPSKKGLERRINWGWARVLPNSTQSLPRVTLGEAVPASCAKKGVLVEKALQTCSIQYTRVVSYYIVCNPRIPRM